MAERIWRLVGLAGKAGSGKDTLADIVMERMSMPLFHGKCGNAAEGEWTKMAFADALKEICVEFLGLSHDDAYTQEGKARMNEFWGMTNRSILQKVGTEAFRNGFADDVWVRILEARIRKAMASGRNVFVCDCRFDDEAEMIRSLGGIVVRIDRPSMDGSMRQEEMRHASERGISPCLVDYAIVNDGTVDDLADKFERL